MNTNKDALDLDELSFFAIDAALQSTSFLVGANAARERCDAWSKNAASVFLRFLFDDTGVPAQARKHAITSFCKLLEGEVVRMIVHKKNNVDLVDAMTKNPEKMRTQLDQIADIYVSAINAGARFGQDTDEAKPKTPKP